MGRIKRLSITFTIIVLTAVLSIRLASLFAAPNNDGLSVIDLFSEKREVDGASILGASDKDGIFFQEGANVLENQY
ncbi:MAG: hypothetical protein MSH47_07150, partial [Bacteroidales bacterium]|nr:hypothetical protein [Bacteroidales bacterium]